MKKLFTFGFCAVLLLLCAFALPLDAEAKQISIFIDNKKVERDNPPCLDEENYRLYLPLRVIAEGLGFSCHWDGNTNSATLKKGADTAVIVLGSSYYTVNGERIKADTYPVAHNGRLMVPVRALSEALKATVHYDELSYAVYITTAPNSEPEQDQQPEQTPEQTPEQQPGQIPDQQPEQTPLLEGRTIVLDAGHGLVQTGGWTDPGAVGYYGLPERDVVMDVVYKMVPLLQELGAEVILTRYENYTYLTLSGRAAYAAKYNADIFISVHCNANESRVYKGTAMYTNSVSFNTKEDTALAKALQKNTVATLGTKDLGLFQGSFGVLRNLPCPGVLAEIAFISNLEEEKKLATDSFRQQAAQGLVNGIVEYFAAK